MASLRHTVRRWAASKDRLEAAELTSQAREAGVDCVCDCAAGSAVTLRGTVCSITVNPLAAVPQFEAELYDGTGRVRLIWMGRHSIPGVEAGRRMEVHGRVTCRSAAEMPAIFNPEYELRPRSRA